MHARTAEDVGSLVREQRRALGMSQAQLAAATGTSRQWVVDLERGKPTLALGLVLRALTAVGLTLRVETTAPAKNDAVHASIDLDAILARARAPLAASPAISARQTPKRRVKSSTAARRKKRA